MSTARKHIIVAVDGWVPPPPVQFDHDAVHFAQTSPEELPGRIEDATILITSSTPISRAGIEGAKDLQLISCMGTGTDHIDKDAARERGVTVCHVPAQNTDSVSEHAFALHYAIRRHIIEMHAIVMDGSTWALNNMLARRLGRPPRTNSEETLVVIGYGALGQNVEKIGKALGMHVLIAERKGSSEARAGRTPFDDALKQGTFFVVVAPLDESTRNMISSTELEAMNPTSVIVNVGRGGVIDELALAKALKDGRIAGAGTDVFEHEPATKENCPLLDSTIPNLIVSPHIAWYSPKTINGTVAIAKANIEGFVAGRPQNVVVAGKGSQS